MKKAYKEMLGDLKPSSQESKGTNDRVLLIDGLNTFIRAFTINPSKNDDGIHVGGIKGFLLSIGHAIRQIKPTRVIICFDGKGGSRRRKKMFPDYKANRSVTRRLTRLDNFTSVDDEKVAMGQQLQRLVQYLEKLPVTVMATENIEADDAIAYICQQVYPKSQCFIMSSDTDFLQLVDDRVVVWAPTKKKFFFKENVKEAFGCNSQNYILYKTLMGDKGDNVPGIKGLGKKTLEKNVPILFEDKVISLENIISYIKDNKNSNAIMTKLSESTEKLELNFDLMQLKETEISGTIKEGIRNIVKKPVQRMIKYEFLKFILEDRLWIVKNPEYWLKDTFFHLDAYASMTHD
tara:strand:- start:210 stop:1253 length:1044 start_codon:yes stop_codon:yes gene_type:complete